MYFISSNLTSMYFVSHQFIYYLISHISFTSMYFFSHLTCTYFVSRLSSYIHMFFLLSYLTSRYVFYLTWHILHLRILSHIVHLRILSHILHLRRYFVPHLTSTYFNSHFRSTYFVPDLTSTYFISSDPDCHPKRLKSLSTFKMSLDDLYRCGGMSVLNKVNVSNK